MSQYRTLAIIPAPPNTWAYREWSSSTKINGQSRLAKMAAFAVVQFHALIHHDEADDRIVVPAAFHDGDPFWQPPRYEEIDEGTTWRIVRSCDWKDCDESSLYPHVHQELVPA